MAGKCLRKHTEWVVMPNDKSSSYYIKKKCDCGAAPGSWTQVAAERDANGKIANKPLGAIFNIDLLHMLPVTGAAILRGMDFTKTESQCATTKGFIINPSLFGLVEEENISNDDKILATAVAMSKTMSSGNLILKVLLFNCFNSCKLFIDGRWFIQTELVLITNDRNLRLRVEVGRWRIAGVKMPTSTAHHNFNNISNIFSITGNLSILHTPIAILYL
uniref:Ribosomal RNA methyltransferase FtsJ domain-containing protein n=1 Tax=Glossina palpalis gambiensis TaxID=67801 RepID=A0A1B0BUB5_9MUSC